MKSPQTKPAKASVAKQTDPSPPPVRNSDQTTVLAFQHLLYGWSALLVFLTLGLALEALHGFKVTAYLNVSNETRRLMWTLAHAHGALLGLVHLGFATTIRQLPSWKGSNRTIASRSLSAAVLLMPAGFFVGGMFIHGGDPGLGIILVPVGGLLLLLSVALTLKALFAARTAT